jgi:hypothetical protein
MIRKPYENQSRGAALLAGHSGMRLLGAGPE